MKPVLKNIEAKAPGAFKMNSLVSIVSRDQRPWAVVLGMARPLSVFKVTKDGEITYIISPEPMAILLGVDKSGIHHYAKQERERNGYKCSFPSYKEVYAAFSTGEGNFLFSDLIQKAIDAGEDRINIQAPSKPVRAPEPVPVLNVPARMFAPVEIPRPVVKSEMADVIATMTTMLKAAEQEHEAAILAIEEAQLKACALETKVLKLREAILVLGE